jgi:hypothetical protein
MRRRAHGFASNWNVLWFGSRCLDMARIYRTAIAVMLLSCAMVIATTSATTSVAILLLQRTMTLAYEKSGTMHALDWFCTDINTFRYIDDQDDIHCQLVAASLSRLQIWNQTSRTIINNTTSTGSTATTTAQSTTTANVVARAENNNNNNNNDDVNVLLKAPTEWIWHGVLEASRSPSLLVRTLQAHSPLVGDHRLAVGTLFHVPHQLSRINLCLTRRFPMPLRLWARVSHLLSCTGYT